jgi:hypothetical protein
MARKGSFLVAKVEVDIICRARFFKAFILDAPSQSRIEVSLVASGWLRELLQYLQP